MVSYRIQLSPNFSAVSLKDFRNCVQFLHRNVGLLTKNSLRFSTSERLHTFNHNVDGILNLRIQLAYNSINQVRQFGLKI